jgi:hypothetical protein
MQQWAITVQLIIWTLLSDAALAFVLLDLEIHLTPLHWGLLAAAGGAQIFAIVTAIKVRLGKYDE